MSNTVENLTTLGFVGWIWSDVISARRLFTVLLFNSKCRVTQLAHGNHDGSSGEW